MAALLTACASGSAILTGTKRPPIKHTKVKIYSSPPSQYEEIGLVQAVGKSGWTMQQKQDYALKELKTQAAKLGANGVILTNNSIGEGSSAGVVSGNMLMMAPVRHAHLSGKAIYVSK